MSENKSTQRTRLTRGRAVELLRVASAGLADRVAGERTMTEATEQAINGYNAVAERFDLPTAAWIDFVSDQEDATSELDDLLGDDAPAEDDEAAQALLDGLLGDDEGDLLGDLGEIGDDSEADLL